MELLRQSHEPRDYRFCILWEHPARHPITCTQQPVVLAMEVKGMLLCGIAASCAACCKVGSGVSTCKSREIQLQGLRPSSQQAAAYLRLQVAASQHACTSCPHAIPISPDDCTAVSMLSQGFWLDLHAQLSQPKADHVCCSSGSSHHWHWLAGC